MAFEGSAMITSAPSILSFSSDITMMESAKQMKNVTTMGFIISLCMAEQCLVYDDDNITAVFIYRNYDIIKIPADAFLGATYLEVSWHTKQTISFSHLSPCNNLFRSFFAQDIEHVFDLFIIHVVFYHRKNFRIRIGRFRSCPVSITRNTISGKTF